MKKKVAVFFGGRSLESDISVITAMQALRNLDRMAYSVEPVYMYDGEMYVGGLGKLSAFTPFCPVDHMRATLYKGELFTIKRGALKKFMRPDVALVCCHGGEGEGGVLQALLEYNGIPVACSDMAASMIAMDKVVSKQLFKELAMNVLPYEAICADELAADCEAVIARLEIEIGYPMIVKPARQGSSIGISKADDRRELEEALDLAARLDNKIIVERRLENFVEVNCAAFKDGDKIVLSQTEQPLTAHDFLTFDDKYMTDGKLNGGGRKSPADIGSLELIVKAGTERLYRALDLNGVVRMDFLVDEGAGRVYINEINTVPGSLAFYLFEPLGIDFATLLDKLIDGAVDFGKRKTPSMRFTSDVLARFKGGSKSQKGGN